MRGERLERGANRADLAIALGRLPRLGAQRVALVLQDPVYALVLALQLPQQPVEFFAALHALSRLLSHAQRRSLEHEPRQQRRIVHCRQRLFEPRGVAAGVGHGEHGDRVDRGIVQARELDRPRVDELRKPLARQGLDLRGDGADARRCAVSRRCAVDRRGAVESGQSSQRPAIRQQGNRRGAQLRFAVLLRDRGELFGSCSRERSDALGNRRRRRRTGAKQCHERSLA